MCWVCGLAGIGESAITRIAPEDTRWRGRLRASFFSHQEEELLDAGRFISTIAYLLSRSLKRNEPSFQQDLDAVKGPFIT